MQKLKENIILQGKVINESILKVDSFLNHQIDPVLMFDIGKEFYDHFKDLKITKILTIEASGIACAVFTGYHFKIPVVFAKKQKPSTNTGLFYKSTVKSFTKNIEYDISVSNEYLSSDDKVLIIDDFLAHGNALRGLFEVCDQAGANILGTGIVIEKTFQNARLTLSDLSLNIFSLAEIISLKDNKIYFK